MRSRLVLLGASNVRRGLPAIVGLARENGIRETFGAFGHGRSYGTRSCIPFRCLPGILECGIWDALHSAVSAPALAVVTDVGNDLLYGAAVETILDWISQCLRRLKNDETRIVITGLPIERLRRLDRLRFLFFRSIFFPGCRLSLEEVIAGVEELNEGLCDLARREGAVWFDPETRWYGWDPVHIRRPSFRKAWASILGVPEAVTHLSRGETWRILRAAPERRWIFGVEQWRPQPAVRVGGGHEIRLY